MRLSYTDIKTKFLRNIQSAGLSDTNVDAEFNYQLGVYYQLMLAKLKNYKTYLSSSFNVGLKATLLSTGVAQGITSITSSGTTATVTTSAAHGYSTSNSVAIAGASVAGFNGAFTITVTSTTTFTYTMAASLSGATAAAAQYYPLPPGYVTSDGIVITVGSVNYPLKLISSEFVWEQLNAVLLQASALPQFYYPRRDDFGIWPIPQSFYTGTMYYHYRDRNLSVADYQAGSIAVTANSNLVVGTSVTFTAAMVGRWLFISDPTVPGQGYEYRIAGYTDSTHITLAQPFVGTTSSGITSYKIGETPEIPEELHPTLVDGITAGYYSDIRKDIPNAQMFLNKFYTGDLGNANRDEGDTSIAAGLIGGINRYSDREDERIINRKPSLNPMQWKSWSSTLAIA